MRTLALSLAAAVAGAVAGVCSVAVHARWWGLLLAVATTLSCLLALRPGWVRLAFGAAYAGATVYLAVPRPEGDFALADDLTGYVMLGLGVSALAFALGTFRRVRPARSDLPT